MTKTEGKTASAAVKELLLQSPDGLREVVRAVLQEVLEAEMTEALGAEKGERTRGPARLPLGLLRPHADHPRRQAGAAGAAGSRRPVLDRAVRALPALRAGAGGDPGRDVRAGRLDAEGEGDHRGAVRPRLLGLGDLAPSTSAWTRAWPPLPAAGWRSRSPT